MGKRNGNTRLGRPFIYRGSRGVDDAEQEGISGEAPEEQEASGLLEIQGGARGGGRRRSGCELPPAKPRRDPSPGPDPSNSLVPRHPLAVANVAVVHVLIATRVSVSSSLQSR